MLKPLYPFFLMLITAAAACVTLPFTLSAQIYLQPLRTDDAAGDQMPVRTIPPIGMPLAQLAGGDMSGSAISGHVINDAALSDRSQAPDTAGIAGVRVILRVGDGSSGIIAGHRISDKMGSFHFADLEPGDYTIELDPVSIPSRYQTSRVTVPAIHVDAASHLLVDVPVAARRSVTGVVFIDVNGDGRFRAKNDTPVEGAQITVPGGIAVTNEHGRYILRDLPSGRLAFLIACPERSENTHAVLDLGPGPATNRILNIALDPLQHTPHTTATLRRP